MTEKDIDRTLERFFGQLLSERAAVVSCVKEQRSETFEKTVQFDTDIPSETIFVSVEIHIRKHSYSNGVPVLE